MAEYRGLWMELTDPRMLASYMEYRGMSVRDLAASARIPSGGGRTKPLSHSVIGHLRTGHRRTCTPQTAGTIERALQVPPGILFRVKVAAHVTAA